MNDFSFLKELGPLGGGVVGVIVVVVLFLRQMNSMTAAYAATAAQQHEEMLEALSNCRRVVQANTAAMVEQRVAIDAMLEVIKK